MLRTAALYGCHSIRLFLLVFITGLGRARIHRSRQLIPCGSFARVLAEI